MREILFIDASRQSLTTVLNGVRYTFDIKYNTRSDRFTFDLYENDVALLHGRKLLTGFNLLGIQRTFDIGVIFCRSIPDNLVQPGRNSFPNGDSRMFHVTDDELAAAAA